MCNGVSITRSDEQASLHAKCPIWYQPGERITLKWSLQVLGDNKVKHVENLGNHLALVFTISLEKSGSGQEICVCCSFSDPIICGLLLPVRNHQVLAFNWLSSRVDKWLQLYQNKDDWWWLIIIIIIINLNTTLQHSTAHQPILVSSRLLSARFSRGLLTIDHIRVTRAVFHVRFTLDQCEMDCLWWFYHWTKDHW